MDRENNWANWKKEKCPDFAKVCVHVYVCLCVCVCVCVYMEAYMQGYE